MKTNGLVDYGGKIHPVFGSKEIGFLSCCCFCLFAFLRQGFSVALQPVLELALVDQTGSKLTEILLPSASRALGLKVCVTTTWLK